VHEEFHGLRITPSIYTTPSEIDVFVDVMKKAAKVGIA
jgi:selenocysteine lyase/cysteine desulfurase